MELEPERKEPAQVETDGDEAPRLAGADRGDHEADETHRRPGEDHQGAGDLDQPDQKAHGLLQLLLGDELIQVPQLSAPAFTLRCSPPSLPERRQPRTTGLHD